MKPVSKTDILIVTASKGRAHLISSTGTYSWITGLGFSCCVAIEPQEVRDYLSTSPGLNHIVLQDRDRGHGYALSALRKHAIENGFSYVLKIDDDIRTIRSETTAKEFKKQNFIRMMDETLMFLNSGLDGVAYPYGNELFDRKKPHSGFNKIFKTIYCININLWKPTPEVSTFEDFYATLIFRSLGGRNVRSAKFGFETLDKTKNIGQTEGGLQMFDRKELAKKELPYFTKRGCTVKIKPDTPWYYEPVLPAFK